MTTTAFVDAGHIVFYKAKGVSLSDAPDKIKPRYLEGLCLRAYLLARPRNYNDVGFSIDVWLRGHRCCAPTKNTVKT